MYYAKSLLPILYEVYTKVEDLRKSFVSVKKERTVQMQSRLLASQPSRLDFALERADLNLLFSKVVNGHWLLKINILGLLQMKPQEFVDLQAPPEFDKHVDENSVLLSIANLAVALYCISTETRFLNDSGGEGGAQKRGTSANRTYEITESENWLSRSLEIAYIFLPHDIPLVGQIISVHNKFHGISKQIIPED
jgi:hypothetical protein